VSAFGRTLLAAAVVLAFLLGRWSGGGPDGAGDGIGEDAARAPTPPAEDLRGPCELVRVIDGDTLDADCGDGRERIRLLRIDTPERDEPGYREATRALADLVDGEDLYLAFEQPGRPERGDHGRLLAYVYTDEGNVNVELVRRGWSPFWTRYGTGRFASAFREAEREARELEAGVWGWR